VPTVSLRARIADLFTLDLRSLGLFRVGLGLLMFVDALYRAVDVEAFWSDTGIWPRDNGFVSLLGAWTPLDLTGELWLPVLLTVVLGVSALLVASGRLWRVGLVGCWVALQSMNLRNGLPLQVADFVHILLLFWAFFLPLGRRFVLGRPPPSDGPTHVRSIATVLFVAQLLWVYIVPGYYKAVEPKWTEGALLIEAAFIDPVATSFLASLLHVPWLLRGLTLVTPWFEILAPLLLLLPWRKGPVRTAMVAVFVGFHLLGIGLMLRLALVPFTLALCWLPVLPTWFWRRMGAGDAEPAAARTLGLPRAVAVVLGVVGVSTFVPSAEQLFGVRAPVPQLVRQAWRQTGVAQGRFSLWTRPTGNRRFMVAARLADGRTMELHHGIPLDWENPPLSPRNNHWYKVFQKLRGRPAVQRGVATWHVRAWEREHGAEARVEYVEVVVRQAVSMAPGFWTSGAWEDGLPEVVDHRALFMVADHGEDLKLIPTSRRPDWIALAEEPAVP
jgi:hypothetical protein